MKPLPQFLQKDEILKRLDTKIKRLSFVVFITTSLIFAGSSIYWNLTQKAFLYQDNERIYYRVTPAPKKPESQPEGHVWKRGSMVRNGEWGWKLFDTKCERKEEQEAEELRKKLFGTVNGYTKEPSDTCVVRFVQDQKEFKKVLKESFTDYLKNDIFLVNFIILIVAILGMVGFLNFVGNYATALIRRIING